ncbi:MAG: LysR family transcriptional regulator [Bdellovibrionota bacterium]
MKLNNIDLNKIATFCQIVDTGNYRRASEQLNVTPSALSQTITKLEAAVGFPLFHRVGRTMVPTENGKKLHKEFRAYHGGFIQAMERLATEKDQVSGVLRIGAYLEFAKSQLAPCLADFLKANPLTQVKLTFDTPSRLQQLLEKGSLDLCFSIYPSGESRIIESRPVYQEELVMIGASSLVSEGFSYSNLVNTPIIEYYFNHQPIRRWIALHYKKKPQNLPIRAYASTAEMVLALVREGTGIGIVPKYILDKNEVGSTLKLIRPTERKFIDHIWMLEQKTPTKPALHRLFSDHVVKYLSAKRKTTDKR